MDQASIYTQTIIADWLQENQISLDILRLDKIHNVVSGNKWFKLKYYLLDAMRQKKNTIATFGGAWSNHIVACAFAANAAGLRSAGVIRGDRPPSLSSTLMDAEEYGMKLYFVSRERYRQKSSVIQDFENANWYWIDEGGYGDAGADGAAEILDTVDKSLYTHIISSVGTGTMLAGLILAGSKEQTIIGISSMKGNFNLKQNIDDLLKDRNDLPHYELFHDYHFGGYGKHPKELINFINEVYMKHRLPLDIVYTGKTFFAINDLVEKNNFEQGSKLLMIHSGGLQGNKSLPPQVLAF